MISINQSFLWLLDAQSGEKTALTPHEATTLIAYSGGQFAKDGKGPLSS